MRPRPKGIGGLYIRQGTKIAKWVDGGFQEFDLRAGDLFAVGPGHDSWVVGDEPYVSLHLLGAEGYASE